MAGPDLESFGSHAVRLSRNQWIIVAIFTVALYALTPVIWKRAEKFEVERDYRMPYALSSDYWHYSRYAQLAAEKYDTVVIGDSVVWGQYVTREQTLSHYMNEMAGGDRIGNLGLDGAHPLALAGLIESYCSAVSGKDVLLYCNSLWMSSPKHDLQVDDEFHFNHPRLVPQFSPRIPCYKDEISPRLGIIVERNVAFNSWTGHLQASYYNQSDIPNWTIEHPYNCPICAVTLQLPPSDNQLRHEPVPWTARGSKKQDFPFVKLENSLQWQAFQRAIEVLQSRNNKVRVIVGPLNEHMMNDASREACQNLRRGIEESLRAKNVACIVPSVLPSELWADASHPLSEGYRIMAREIVETKKE